MKRLLALIMLLSALTGCAPQLSPPRSTITEKWVVKILHDEFLETSTCRIERGLVNDHALNVNSDWYKNLITQLSFYVENREGQIRAGIKNDGNLPLIGDIQIKTDKKLFTLRQSDTQLDIAPDVTIPMPDVYGDSLSAEQKAQLQKSMDQTQELIMKMGSPYRFFQNEEALAFLKSVVKSQKLVKYRLISVNAQASTVGVVPVNQDFIKALEKCGITLEEGT